MADDTSNAEEEVRAYRGFRPLTFSRKDVDLLRQAAHSQDFYGRDYNADHFDEEGKAALLSLADRIEALLPPE